MEPLYFPYARRPSFIFSYCSNTSYHRCLLTHEFFRYSTPAYQIPLSSSHIKIIFFLPYSYGFIYFFHYSSAHLIITFNWHINLVATIYRRADRPCKSFFPLHPKKILSHFLRIHIDYYIFLHYLKTQLRVTSNWNSIVLQPQYTFL